MKYDPDIIDRFAEELYSRASMIVIWTTATWAVIGLFAGGVVGETFLGGALLPMVIGAAGAGFLGYRRGEEKAFALKLQAQTALCQVQIERNTRPG